MRWHRIDQESCYDYDEAKGGRETTQEKSGLKFRNTLHTQIQTHTYIWQQVHQSEHHPFFLELSGVQGSASNVHILLSELSTLYRAELRAKIVVAAVHRSVLIIKFTANTSFMFHYRLNMTTSIHHLILFITLAIALSALWLPMLAINIAVISWLWLSGCWDAVCISLRQSEMDQYTRGGWIRSSVCMCVSRQPREIGVHKCWRLHAASHLSFIHIFVFNCCMHKYWLLIRATFLAQEQVHWQYISLWPFPFPVVRWL